MRITRDAVGPIFDSRPSDARGGSGVFFTTPHFDGYPAVLVRLDEIDADELEELIAEAWLCRAPRALARAWLEERRSG